MLPGVEIQAQANQPEASKKEFGFDSVSAERYLQQFKSNRWLTTRKPNKGGCTVDDSNQKLIEFAKDLFTSWDANGDGSINENEMIISLVSIGMAPDHKVAKKICIALGPRNHQDESNQEFELCLDDFLAIFNQDHISDKLM